MPVQKFELGTESLAVLCHLLKDQSSDVRIQTARSLTVAGPDEASTSALIAAAGDSDRGVRLAIAEALLQLNGPDDRTAAKALCGLVADPGPVADRFQILKVLQRASEATQDQAMEALAGLLSHADPAVLPDLVACLGESGPRARAALPALEKLLDDHEPSTRAAAVMAIQAIDGAGTAMPGAGMSAMIGIGTPGAGAATGINATGKPSARVLAVLLEMIAERNLPQDWRSYAFGQIHELNPKALSKATPSLILQLGDPSTDVRHAALELLQMVIEDTPAEMPGPAEGK